jgi:hypothetical protein
VTTTDHHRDHQARTVTGPTALGGPARLTARGRIAAAAACLAAFVVGIFAEPLGLVGWWL